MRILVNASTIVVGGGIQNTLSFLTEALRDNSPYEWTVAASEKLAVEMRQCLPEALTSTHVFARSPAQNRAARREILALEAKLEPDCIFTFNGPAYVKFRRPHLLGYATPWVTHPTWLAYGTKAFPFEMLKTAAGAAYKAHWFRFADAWVTETNVSKRGMERRLGLDPSKVFVVPNSCGVLYRERDCSRPFPRPGQKIRILCFAAAYSHKRLHFLPDVARQLEIQDPQLDFEFVITLPTDSSMLREVERKAARYGVSTRIKNEGRIAVADGPQLYAGCDICFMPTVLETFSATYPEAMAMGLPIVATDLGFATDVCRDAALYFHPTSAREAADRILQLLRSESLWSQCIARGKAVLQQFPTPRQKFEAYLRILCDLVGRSHTPQPALSA